MLKLLDTTDPNFTFEAVFLPFFKNEVTDSNRKVYKRGMPYRFVAVDLEGNQLFSTPNGLCDAIIVDGADLQPCSGQKYGNQFHYYCNDGVQLGNHSFSIKQKANQRYSIKHEGLDYGSVKEFYEYIAAHLPYELSYVSFAQRIKAHGDVLRSIAPKMSRQEATRRGKNRSPWGKSPGILWG